MSDIRIYGTEHKFLTHPVLVPPLLCVIWSRPFTFLFALFCKLLISVFCTFYLGIKCNILTLNVNKEVEGSWSANTPEIPVSLPPTRILFCNILNHFHFTYKTFSLIYNLLLKKKFYSSQGIVFWWVVVILGPFANITLTCFLYTLTSWHCCLLTWRKLAAQLCLLNMDTQQTLPYSANVLACAVYSVPPGVEKLKRKSLLSCIIHFMLLF